MSIRCKNGRITYVDGDSLQSRRHKSQIKLDLEEAERCYAPQFGGAKDPVNFAGIVAANVLGADTPLRHWDDIEGGLLLDVREAMELSVESVDGAIHIPLYRERPVSPT